MRTALKQLSLRSRILTILLSVSLLPLLIMSFGAWIVFGRLSERKSLEVQRTVVESHARAVEAYLGERMCAIRLLASTQNLTEITDQDRLKHLLSSLNNDGGSGFIDLGVIDSQGRHLAYVGPYELLDKNYHETDWFKQVWAEGVYISDVFLGYRKVPHCIIAVKSYQGETPWILRATIDSDRFDALVKTGSLGETGDVFIVNRAGLYQTSPKKGARLDSSALAGRLESYRGVQNRKVKINGTTKIQVTTWINNNQWLLVAERDAAEVRAPVTRAIFKGALIAAASMILIIITTFLATRHLTSRIDVANAQREEMVRAFMRSAKLASIGELAAGLAHEINNPLAIIAADQTNIGDIVKDIPDNFTGREEVQESLERSKRQVQRCKNITTRMLQFGRKRDTELKQTDLPGCLRDTISLLERQASVRNIKLILETEDNLPPALVDPIELEQVIINLVNNSFHAMRDGGEIRFAVRRASVAGLDELIVEAGDNGSGMPPEVLERIFEPFFTTKKFGQGTGLGLSVCYGIVQSWGGKMEAESEPGRGTTMRLKLPVKPENKFPDINKGESWIG